MEAVEIHLCGLGGMSEAGSLCGLIISHPHWFVNPIILSVGQWFNVHTVVSVSSGDSRISGRARLLLGPTRVLFLSNQLLLDFPFWGASCLGTSGRYSEIIIWENVAWDHDRGLAIVFLFLQF